MFFFLSLLCGFLILIPVVAFGFLCWGYSVHPNLILRGSNRKASPVMLWGRILPKVTWSRRCKACYVRLQRGGVIGVQVLLLPKWGILDTSGPCFGGTVKAQQE